MASVLRTRLLKRWVAAGFAGSRVSAGNVFFEGPVMYSYGLHYPMIRIVKDKQGRQVALVNASYASSSTAKQTGQMTYLLRQECPGIPQLYTRAINQVPGTPEGVAGIFEDIDGALDKLGKARRWGTFRSWRERLRWLEADMRRYMDLFMTAGRRRAALRKLATRHARLAKLLTEEQMVTLSARELSHNLR